MTEDINEAYVFACVGVHSLLRVYLTVIYKYKHTSHLSGCQVISVMSK